MGLTRDAHPTAGRLVDYHSDRLLDVEELQIEEHTSACGACTELSRRVSRLSRAWDQVMTPEAGWGAGAFIM